MGQPCVSVCIPVRNEADTIGAIVNGLTAGSVAAGRIEVVVVDDGSDDGTSAIAAAAGARVVANTDRPGKGGALRTAVAATRAEVLCFLDGDVAHYDPDVVERLVAPLADPGVVLVKPRYRRPLWGVPDEGGRVTELVARPLLARLHPAVAHIRQPLAGETAVRRGALAGIDLADGYAIEIALLLDVAARFGPAAIAEVDLGERVHRNRPLRELRTQADEVIDAVFGRGAPGPQARPSPTAKAPLLR